MSRGLGIVQRFVVEQLTQAGVWLPAVTLALDWATSRGREYNQSDYRAVVRAIHTLAGQGVIKEGTGRVRWHDRALLHLEKTGEVGLTRAPWRGGQRIVAIKQTTDLSVPCT